MWEEGKEGREERGKEGKREKAKGKAFFFIPSSYFSLPPDLVGQIYCFFFY